MTVFDYFFVVVAMSLMTEKLYRAEAKFALFGIVLAGIVFLLMRILSSCEKNYTENVKPLWLELMTLETLKIQKKMLCHHRGSNFRPQKHYKLHKISSSHWGSNF